MKGIYLTQEGKKEIEAKIIYLQELEENEFMDEFIINDYLTQIRIYKEILASAIILPVEESWANITDSTLAFHYHQSFPQGVIIQPKQ